MGLFEDIMADDIEAKQNDSTDKWLADATINYANNQSDPTFMQAAINKLKETPANALSAAKATGELFGSAAMWPIGKLGNIVAQGNQEIGNVLAKYVWPEEAAKAGFVPKTRDEIKQLGSDIEEGLNMLIPRSEDPKTRYMIDTIGKGLEKALGWSKEISDIVEQGTGSSTLGETARFMAELAAFAKVHEVGKRAEVSLRKSLKKIKKGADPGTTLESELDNIFKDQEKPDLSTPQKRQEYINSIAPDELRTPEGRQDLINAVMPKEEEGKTTYTNIEKPTETPRETISGAKTVGESNQEAKAHIDQLQELTKNLQPQQRVSALDNLNRIREQLGLPKYELPKKETINAESLREDAGRVQEGGTVRQGSETKSGENLQLETSKETSEPQVEIGKKVASDLSTPESEIQYDGEFDPGSGFPVSHQFTIKKGPNEGSTFITKDLSPETVKAKYDEIVGENNYIQKINEGKVIDTLGMSDQEIRLMETLGKSSFDVLRDIKKTKNAPTPIDLDKLPDWVEIELESLYKDKSAPVRMKEIATQLLEKGELDKPGLVKTFKKWYAENKEAQEGPEVSPEATMVNPETGREAGGFATPVKPVIESDYHLKRDALEKSGPLKNSAGNVIKNKTIAESYMEELGLKGKLVKDPESGGWRVRKSAADRAKFESELKKDWEAQLKEDGLAEIEEPGYIEKESDLFDYFTNQRGEVSIDLEAVKKIKDLFNTGKYSSDEIARALRAKGIPEDKISSIFNKTYVKKLNEGYSKFLEKGQDPNELLPARTKKGGRKAPQVSRGEANAIATAKDIKGRLWNENWSIETADKTFSRITQENGPMIEKTFLDPMMKADADSIREFKQKQKLSKNLRKDLDNKSQKRVGIYAIAQQEGGSVILEKMGYSDIPKLNESELKAYNALRDEFKTFYDRVNDAREASGESRFPAVDNYFTWINDMNWLREEHGIGMLDNWNTMESKLFNEQINPSFRYAKHRGGDLPRKLELNPFTIYETYTKAALDTIYKAPVLSKLHELLGSKYGLKDNAPNMYNFLHAWRETQTGKPHIFNEASPKTVKALRTLNNNVVVSLLAGTAKTALIQPTSLLGSFVELDHHLISGAVKSLDPKEWKRAYETSNTLISRSPDVAIYETLEGSGKLGKLQRKVASTTLAPLTMLDQLSAVMTWLGAEAKAKKLGLEDPVKYADSIVNKTQASASKVIRSPIQRHILGQTVTGLQTFVINHWGWLTRDVLGINNADMSNPQMVGKVTKFVIGSTIINSLYDQLGVESPLPTPIKAYNESKETSDNESKALYAGAKELLEYIPIYGGTIKYGSQFGGPMVNTLWDLVNNIDADEWNKIAEGDLEDVKLNKTGLTDIAKLLGIPGTNQFSKSFNAYKKEGNTLDIILGNYVEGDKIKRPSKSSSPRRPKK